MDFIGTGANSETNVDGQAGQWSADCRDTVDEVVFTIRMKAP
jgi:hypothetical protein